MGRTLIQSGGNSQWQVSATTAGPGFIHPYFEQLPEVDFFTADISFEGGALDVVYRIDTGLVTPELAARLQFQLDRLKLNQRYTAQINIFISEQRTAIMMLRDFGPAIVREFLFRNAASLATSFHRNDWRVALMRALAEEPGFCSDPGLYLGNDDEAA